MKTQILKKIYRVVLYLRLSSDGGDNKESDGISNQRILIRGYLDGKSEFVIVKEFVDDGFTGTNFDRPDFQKMSSALLDAQKAKIDWGEELIRYQNFKTITNEIADRFIDRVIIKNA